MIKLLIFDCFGVLRNECSVRWMNAHFNKEDAERVQNTIVHPGDMGRFTGEEAFRLLSLASGEPAGQIKNDWVTSAAVKEDTVQTVLKLKNHFQTALLSNALGGLMEAVFAPGELERLFDHRFVSYHEKLAKPDPECFLRLLRRAGVAPDEAVFTDDIPKNCKAAADLGIHSIVFQNSEQYLTELNKILEACGQNSGISAAACEPEEE